MSSTRATNGRNHFGLRLRCKLVGEEARTRPPLWSRDVENGAGSRGLGSIPEGVRHRSGDVRREPLEVLYASNGQEALAQVAQVPSIDLIVLDVNMPVMDGPAFLDRLRRDYASLDIPVMFSSTRAYA